MSFHCRARASRATAINLRRLLTLGLTGADGQWALA